MANFENSNRNHCIQRPQIWRIFPKKKIMPTSEYNLHNHEQYRNFDVLLTVQLSIFISVFNQLDAQNLFHSKFYFMPLHVSSTCAYHQQVKIALHSLWYHHTYRWPSRARGMR